MPRLPALRVGALSNLAEQLRFTPRAAARRQVERAEALISKLDDEQTYPQDWLVYSITGYRPDAGKGEPELVQGRVLRAELGAFIERLSEGAEWTREDLSGAGWMSAPEVCAAWKVSVKTLERYRRRGLPARRVRGARGRTVLVFKRTLVDALFARERVGLGKAAAFSRIDRAMAAKMVRRAQRYGRVLGWSMSRAAERIAARFGRSGEAVRQLLKRAEAMRPARERVFAAGRPLDAHARRVAERASRRGVPLESIAAHFGKSAPAVHRAVGLRRVEVLRAADAGRPASIAEALDGRAGYEDELLRHPAVNTGLGAPGAPTLLEHLRQSIATGWPDRAVELARSRAACALRHRAGSVLARIVRKAASAADLDRVQTDLLWAARLIAELVRSQQMLVLKSIEAVFGRGAEDLAPALAVSALRAATMAAAHTALLFDPFKPGAGAGTSGRLAAPTGLAINRALAHVLSAHEAALAAVVKGRATTIIRRETAADVALEDWTREVTPWQRYLEPTTRVRALAMSVKLDGAPSRAAALALKYGLGAAERPHTREEIAARLRVGEMVLARWGVK